MPLFCKNDVTIITATWWLWFSLFRARDNIAAWISSKIRKIVELLPQCPRPRFDWGILDLQTLHVVWHKKFAKYLQNICEKFAKNSWKICKKFAKNQNSLKILEFFTNFLQILREFWFFANFSRIFCKFFTNFSQIFREYFANISQNFREFFAPDHVKSP